MVTSDPELQAGLLSLVRVVVEGGEVLQGGPVAELEPVQCAGQGGQCNTWYWSSVWTMAGRWVRRVRTVWKTSTTPSYCIRSSTMEREMKTPVRPTPALQNITVQCGEVVTAGDAFLFSASRLQIQFLLLSTIPVDIQVGTGKRRPEVGIATLCKVPRQRQSFSTE